MLIALAYLSALIAILATLPYILDVVKGNTRPNLVTWGTWSLLNLITAIAAFADGSWQAAVFASAIGSCTVIVAILSLSKGVKKYTAFDVVCQVLALLAIVAWQVTSDPSWAIVFTIAGSFIASLPTVRHAWFKPKEETWQYFAVDAFAAFLSILSVSNVTFSSAGFPIYILVNDLLILSVIFFRSSHKR